MGKWNLIELGCLTGSGKASCLDSQGPGLSVLWSPTLILMPGQTGEKGQETWDEQLLLQ